MSEPQPNAAPSARNTDTTTPCWNPEFEFTLWSTAIAFGGIGGKSETELIGELLRHAQEHPGAILVLLNVLAMRTRRLEATHALLAHLYEYTEPDDRAGLASRLRFMAQDGHIYHLADILGLNPDGTLVAGPEEFAAVRRDA